MSVHVEQTSSTEGQPDKHEPQDGVASAGTRKPLGQLAVEGGFITPQQLASAFAEISGSGKRLGEVLVARKWIDEQQLDRLLAHQARLAPAPEDAEAEASGDGKTAGDEATGEPARNLDDLLAEVERRAAAASRRAGREAELEARLTESETLLQLKDQDVATAHHEIERLEGLLAQRDEHDATIRAALERVTHQLSERDPDA